MPIDWNAPADEAPVQVLTRVMRKEQDGRGGLESTRQPKSNAERIERVEAGIRRRVEAMPADRRPDEEVVQRVVAGARNGLAKVESEPLPSLTVAEVSGLEAVILTDGSRPSLFVVGGFVDLAHPDVGEWQGRLQLMEASIRKVTAAVGGIRIPNQKEPIGTAFVIAPGVVLTNRHVLEEIAVFRPGDQKWILHRPNDTVIDFIGELAGAGKTSFKVKGVRFAGPDAIKRMINFKNLDLAVLDVDPESDEGFPDRIIFEDTPDVVQPDHDLCVIGFPATIKLFTGEGPPPAGTETQEVIAEIFDNTFGVKKLAPGQVDLGIGEHPKDGRKWIFTHDASTLRGNSGSCVIDLTADGTPVIGIHFGGLARDQNFAHAAAALQHQLAEQNATFV